MDAAPVLDDATTTQPDAGAADTTSTTDATVPEDTENAEDATVDTAAPVDTASNAKIVSISLKAEKTGLLLAERTIFSVLVKRADGSEGPPPKEEVFTLTVDGIVQTGAGLAAAGSKQPAVAAWRFGGKLQLVGVRPGSAQVVAKLGSRISPPLKMTVAWRDTPGIWAATATADGETKAARIASGGATVHLQGKQIGAGGLTASLRFPLATNAGARLDLAKAPASGTLAITMGFANLGGATMKPVEGAFWLDQIDKGRFRGTFLGRTTQLKPVAGVFVIDRLGFFGVDLLDEPVQVAKSDNVWPSTGAHYSRVSLTAVGNGKAVLYARQIKDGLKANLLRWQIDAKTGVITPLTPLIANANAYVGSPTTKAPAFGQVIRASHPTVTAELWEGRDGKGSTKPHRLWLHLLDPSGKEIAKPVVVSDDVCDGSCRPQIALLPSTRFVVLWSPPSGGVKVRRIKGQLAAGAVAFVLDAPQVLTTTGKDGALAAHDNNVLTGWFDPDKGPVWRLYQNKATGKLSAQTLAEGVGATSTKAPAQALLAIKAPTGAPNLLFATAWLDYQPGGKLTVRPIGLDGTALGLPTKLGDVDADALWGRVGKDGQMTLLLRSDKGVLTARKVRFSSFKAPAAALGEPVTLFGGGGYPVQPALLYVPDADVWITAWSGQDESPGITVRRFR